MNKTLTITNKENLGLNQFIRQVFHRVEEEIRKEEAYEHRVILMTRQPNGDWTVDGTPIVITFEDEDRDDIQFITIREGGEE